MRGRGLLRNGELLKKGELDDGVGGLVGGRGKGK